VHGRLRRLPQIIRGLQPDRFRRERDILSRAGGDSLDLLQAEAQQIDLSDPALGFGTELRQLRPGSAILRPEI
jgi:hypothetical protein